MSEGASVERRRLGRKTGAKVDQLIEFGTVICIIGRTEQQQEEHGRTIRTSDCQPFDRRRKYQGFAESKRDYCSTRRSVA